MKKESLNWYKQGEADLRKAKILSENNEFDGCVFYCQQAVEKWLKSIIIQEKNELIKIHDLVILGKKINLPKEYLEKLKELNSAYLESRYGIGLEDIPAETFTKEDALNSLKNSRGDNEMDEKKDIMIVKDFKEKIKKSFPVNKIILFGSRATGNASRWSDFDIIIISDKFKKIKKIKRAIQFYNYWDVDYPVDFICLTNNEFNKLKNNITIVQQAVKEGIEIK